MNEKVLIVSIADFLNRFSPEEVFGSKLAIIDMDGVEAEVLDKPVRFDAFSMFIATRGEMSIEINYQTHKLGRNMSLMLFNENLLDNIRFSPDFKGYHLIIAKDLAIEIVREFDEIPSLEVPKHLNPVSELSDTDMLLIQTHIERIRSSIADKKHPFYRNIIKNELGLLLMHFLHIRMRETSNISTMRKMSHKEEIAIQFISLLIENYKDQHEVNFYSGELCITPEYLSKVMKEFSGKTANIWINEALIAEAKILLRKPNATILQVAEELYFFDQSHFGKFFKKHTGKGPLEYRNSMLK